MVDIARFLVTSLRVDVRRAIESDLLTDYHSSLEARGIRDYPFERCINDFKGALLWNLTTPIALHLTRIATQGGKWPDTLPIIERCLTAIDDWNASELL